MTDKVISFFTGKPASEDEIDGEISAEMREAMETILTHYIERIRVGEVASIVLGTLSPDGTASCYVTGESVAEVIGLSTLVQQHTLRTVCEASSEP